MPMMGGDDCCSPGMGQRRSCCWAHCVAA
jgi:hypothetical protein